jgi:hypothetical protein
MDCRQHLAIARKRVKLDVSLPSVLHVLSVTPFEKIPLFQLFFDNHADSFFLTIDERECDSNAVIAAQVFSLGEASHDSKVGLGRQ